MQSTLPTEAGGRAGGEQGGGTSRRRRPVEASADAADLDTPASRGYSISRGCLLIE
jgi:hypothetical protein